MRCKGCKTELNQSHYQDRHWKFRSSETGVGLFECPDCGMTVVRRYKVNWFLPAALFVAGALSPLTFISILYFVEVTLQQSEPVSFWTAAAVQVVPIATLWIGILQTVEVRAE